MPRTGALRHARLGTTPVPTCGCAVPAAAAECIREVAEPQPAVLLIEDEASMRKFVQISLTSSGHRVVEAATGREGLALASARPPDIVVLDIGLPDMDGFDVLRRLREWTAVPVIVLSARGQEEDKVRALNDGADDYLTKPFGPAELIARIGVGLRHAARQAAGGQPVVVTGELRVDLVRRLVFLQGAEVHLTPIEYRLLSALAKHAGRVLTHKQLLRDVWGPGEGHQAQLVRVHMAQLRRKLESDTARPRYIVTEPGVGYRLKMEGDPPAQP